MHCATCMNCKICWQYQAGPEPLRVQSASCIATDSIWLCEIQTVARVEHDCDEFKSTGPIHLPDYLDSLPKERVLEKYDPIQRRWRPVEWNGEKHVYKSGV